MKEFFNPLSGVEIRMSQVEHFWKINCQGWGGGGGATSISESRVCISDGPISKNKQQILSFPLNISSVNVTKSTGNCRAGNCRAVWSHLLKKSLMENFIFCAVEGPILKYIFFFSYSLRAASLTTYALLLVYCLKKITFFNRRVSIRL